MPKLGLASWHVGDVLRLGPITPPHHDLTHGGGGGGGGGGGRSATGDHVRSGSAHIDAGAPRSAPACGVMLAELGYLMRRGGRQGYGQGAFEVSCVGSCSCVRRATRFPELLPFPIVQVL